MWRTRRGGTAPGAHALLPLPHLHHLLTPPSPPPTPPHPHPPTPFKRLPARLAFSLPTSFPPFFFFGEDGPLSCCPPPPPTFSRFWQQQFLKAHLVFYSATCCTPVHPILPSLSFPLTACLSGILLTFTDVFHFYLPKIPDSESSKLCSEGLCLGQHLHRITIWTQSGITRRWTCR